MRGAFLRSVGSPLLNAGTGFDGGYFDLACEATITDGAGSKSYSRTIAVDICGVLWVTEKGRGATHLLKNPGNN